MLGFSLPKLLVLIAVIAIVWYGFKAMGRSKQKRQADAKHAARDNASQIAVKDMIQCPKCGAYSASLETHTCDA